MFIELWKLQFQMIMAPSRQILWSSYNILLEDKHNYYPEINKK